MRKRSPYFVPLFLHSRCDCLWSCSSSSIPSHCPKLGVDDCSCPLQPCLPGSLRIPLVEKRGQVGSLLYAEEPSGGSGSHLSQHRHWNSFPTVSASSPCSDLPMQLLSACSGRKAWWRFDSVVGGTVHILEYCWASLNPPWILISKLACPCGNLQKSSRGRVRSLMLGNPYELAHSKTVYNPNDR